MTPSSSVIADLAPSGILRAAINLANTAMVRIGPEGELAGPAIDLARFVASQAGLPLEFQRHTSAGRLVEAATHGEGWDIASLAIDPARAQRFHFSPPYHSTSACFAVRAASRAGSLTDIDKPGARIASTRGAAYQLYLERRVKAATLVMHDNPQSAHSAFLADGFDALAGVQATLEAGFADDASVRLTPEFVRIEQAIAVPRYRTLAMSWIDVAVTTYLACTGAAK